MTSLKFELFFSVQATTKLTVDGHGNAHAESILEAIPASDAKKLKRAVRKSRESRQVLKFYHRALLKV